MAAAHGEVLQRAEHIADHITEHISDQSEISEIFVKIQSFQDFEAFKELYVAQLCAHGEKTLQAVEIHHVN